MIFQNILSALIAVGAMGALLGLGLAVASRLLAVHKDQRVESVAKILPGINCGACGYAGCEAYAEAVVLKGEKLDLCKPGGSEVTMKLGETLGVEVQAGAGKLVAKVLCGGGWAEAKRSFEYEGIEDCNAAYALYGGGKVCRFGCLGLGSCIKVCPVDAIEKTGTGLVRVDPDLCISCEKCVEICPTGVMQMVPYSADRIVACNSTDKGGVVRKYCSVGCIGCKKCEKASPEGGFVVENNLARIDYTKTGDRSAAETACPTSCIKSVQPALVVTPSGNEPNEGH
jgi:Na+-translocating ferredoxin:NAD+ oxidoreductase subunit B